MNKILLVVLVSLSFSLQAEVKIQFHLPDEIIEKTLLLNQPQIVHQEKRVTTHFQLNATLVSENLNNAEVDFVLTITGPQGRRIIHEYPIETIPLNKIYAIKNVNYLYTLVVQATNS